MKLFLFFFMIGFSSVALSDDVDDFIAFTGVKSLLEETNKGFMSDVYEQNPFLAERPELVESFVEENVSFSSFEAEIRKLIESKFSKEELSSVALAVSELSDENKIIKYYATELGLRVFESKAQIEDLVLSGAISRIQHPTEGIEPYIRSRI